MPPPPFIDVKSTSKERRTKKMKAVQENDSLRRQKAAVTEAAMDEGPLNRYNQPVLSCDEASESEDLDVLPTIRNRSSSSSSKDLECAADDSESWDRNVSYKYARADKDRKHVDPFEMDEATLNEYVLRCRPGKGIVQILREKRKRLCGKSQNREDSGSEEELCREDDGNDYCDDYEQDDPRSRNERKGRRRWKVSALYHPSMEDRLLRDMDADLEARLERLWEQKQKQRRAAASSACLSDESELLTPIQSDDDEEEAADSASRCHTPDHGQVFTAQDRGKLLELERELMEQQQQELLDDKLREEKCLKYLHNQKMAPLAQLAINQSQVRTFYEHQATGEDCIRLEPHHLVLHHKLPQHPWVQEGISYQEFAQREKERAAAAYAEYARTTDYEKTMVTVERLGRRYEKMFVERLKEAMFDHWEETDKLVLDEWLLVCPLLMHGGNAKKTRRHAVPFFRVSDMNILFECWLEVGPLKDVLLLHHRICQWICMLDQPARCVREVMAYMERLKITKKKRVNRISSPQRQPPPPSATDYVTEEFEKDLWETMIHEVYVRGRENCMKWFRLPEAELSAMRKPLPRNQLDKLLKHKDPVARQAARLKSFCKSASKSCELEVPHVRDSSSSVGDSDNEEEGGQSGLYSGDEHTEGEDSCNDVGQRQDETHQSEEDVDHSAVRVKAVESVSEEHLIGNKAATPRDEQRPEPCTSSHDRNEVMSQSTAQHTPLRLEKRPLDGGEKSGSKTKKMSRGDVGVVTQDDNALKKVYPQEQTNVLTPSH